ncbi:MAG TPA: hypothetical protein VGP99_12520 [Tepidisphaeraceae bacterium]|jgi:hypothetical protein|nr:hypothetical protein [Tepidisphaeraceae bacterium]
MKKILGGMVALAAMTLLSSLCAAATIEFNELGKPAGTLLDGQSFPTLAISFASDETYLANDSRFTANGSSDSWGILTRTNAADNVFSVSFDSTHHATSITFDWVTLWSVDFYATGYDEDGGTKVFQLHGLSPSMNYGTNSLVADAGEKFTKVTFHDGAGFVGIGKLSYTTGNEGNVAAVPTPAAVWGGLGLMGMLAVSAGVRARRR